MSSFQTFQGGLPPLRTKYSQHGTGFLSSLKRFVMPIAKTVLPSLFGGVADVVSGKSTATEALKRHGADAIQNVGAQIGDTIRADRTPPTKKYKRQPQPSPSKKKKKLDPRKRQRRH